MKKNLLFFCFAILMQLQSSAADKIWIGATNALWSAPGSWIGGVPGISDTAVFNTGALAMSVMVDINPAIAKIKVLNNTDVTFTAPSSKTISLDNGGSSNLVLFIETGSIIELGGGSPGDVNLNTYGTVENKSEIWGKIYFYLGSNWVVNLSPTQTSKIDVFGIVFYGINTGALISSTTSSLLFHSGSQLIIGRNNNGVPTADYQDGSAIAVVGITTNITPFASGGAIFNGLIEWSCAGQTVSGQNAIVFGDGLTIDSFRVVNTGTGTLRGNTEIQGVTIGNLEIDGGSFEMASPRTADRTVTITNNIEVSGGNFWMNATDATDITTAHSISATVNGNVLVSSGNLNLSNRPNGTGGTYGVGNIHCKEYFMQNGGLVTETGAIPPISDASIIYMDGIIAQNLQLTNWTNQVRLSIDNATNGVLLLNNITCPEYLFMLTPGAYAVLGNNNLTVTYNQFIRNNAGALPTRIITNGTGILKVMSIPASSSVLFPVGYIPSTYNPVIIAPQATASTNDYNVRVEIGNNPGGIYNATRTINKTWYISPTTNITSGSVNLSFQYTAADANAFCIPTANMELGHFIPGTPGSWNLDPLVNVAPSGSDPYIAGPYAPGTLGSSFVIGNVGSILVFEKIVNLIGQKKNDKGYLSWTISNTEGVKELQIQHSSNGVSFKNLATVGITQTSFTDDQLLAGMNYYRLKMIDANGKITYSTIIALLNKETGFDIVNLAPTLVTGNAVLNVTAAQKTKMDIVITDISGRQVQKIAYNLIAGSNQFTVNLANLTAGTYQMKGYTMDGVSKTIRFVKQ